MTFFSDKNSRSIIYPYRTYQQIQLGIYTDNFLYIITHIDVQIKNGMSEINLDLQLSNINVLL